MEEIEESYKESIELLDNLFLDNMKKGGDLKKLETNYISSLHQLRQKYVLAYSAYLKNQKSKIKINLPPKDLRKFAVFKSERIKLILDEKEEKRIKKEISKFKMSRKAKAVFSSLVPGYGLFLYFLFRANIKQFWTNTLDKKDKFLEKSKDNLEKSWETTVSLSLELLKRLSAFLLSLLSSLKKFINFLTTKFKKKIPEKQVIESKPTTSEKSPEEIPVTTIEISKAS